MIQGKAIKCGDNVDTDQIIGAEHLTMPTVQDMVQHMFANDANVSANFQPGDVIVAGHNFGCGSSREQAPAVLKAAGVSAVIARSFARIFYRNSINLALLILECDQTDEISNLDQLRIDPQTGNIRNLTSNHEYTTVPLSDFVRQILQAGGIVSYITSKRS